MHGKLFCAPRDANTVLVYDTFTSKLSLPAVPRNLDSDHPLGEWSRAVALNGKVYMIPLNAAYVLIVDATTLEVTGSDAIPNDIRSPTGFQHFPCAGLAARTCAGGAGANMWSGGTVIDGKIYGK